ncbi:MAG: hypothetical protein ACK4WH_08760 [Phycisphaerales bacterium]
MFALLSSMAITLASLGSPAASSCCQGGCPCPCDCCPDCCCCETCGCPECASGSCCDGACCGGK